MSSQSLESMGDIKNHCLLLSRYANPELQKEEFAWEKAVEA